RYVVQALATLAFVGYRGDFFRDELIQALRILQDGHVSRQAMLGSWAGAMGQTQFMPSSFLKYAVDFDQDGRKDIWGSVPDALAGRLGSESGEAVRQFQLRHGIVPADGCAGRPLYEALEAAWRSAGSPTP